MCCVLCCRLCRSHTMRQPNEALPVFPVSAMPPMILAPLMSQRSVLCPTLRTRRLQRSASANPPTPPPTPPKHRCSPPLPILRRLLVATPQAALASHHRALIRLVGLWAPLLLRASGRPLGVARCLFQEGP